jgi:aminomethyltransferase
MKRSPFFPEIAAHNPALAGIQGWEVPNIFTSPEEEHTAVRERVGLLDWSTTGEFEIQGPDALAVVQQLIVNDAAKMPVNRVLYTTMLNPDGGIMSDITVYRLGPEHYMLMTAWGSNAADQRPEYELLLEHSQGKNAYVHDASPGVGLLALQGPKARALLGELTEADLGSLAYMWAVPARVAGIRALISRTGYTGELGYEILIPVEHAHDFWDALTSAGKKHGLALVGMVAAFSLRMEKGYIMRFDFAGGRTPYEIGLGWTVKLDKGDFIGREALVRRKETGFADKLVNLAIQDGYVPPGGDSLLHAGREVGQTTSAAFGYTVGQALTLGYVPVSLAEPGSEMQVVDKEGNAHPAVVGPRSPYDPENIRIRG